MSLQPILRTSSACLRGFLSGRGITRGYATKAEKCWNCTKAVSPSEPFFCGDCNRIQPVTSSNLFEYIGVPTQFEVKDVELKKRFRNLQSKLHPDKFAQTSPKERELSDEHSRMLNTAMNTLSEPLNRAKYLIEVLGGEDVKENQMDSEGLMEMLDWQEKVAEMSEESELREEREKLQTEINSTLSVLGKHFNDKKLQDAKEDIARLSYLYSIRNSINTRIQKSFEQ